MMESMTSGKGVTFFKFGVAPANYQGETTYLPTGSKKLGHFQGTQEITFKNGDKGTTHYFYDKETESTYGISGSARLNGLMSKVDKGCLTEITYKGKESTPNGRMAHAFDVARDKEDIFINERKESTEANSTEASPAPAMTESAMPETTFEADDIPF